MITIKKLNVYVTPPRTSQQLPPVLAAMLAQAMQPSTSKQPGQASSVPRIGEEWPEQGGVYAGVVRAPNGKPNYHLIVPTSAGACNDSIKWGGYNEDADTAKCDRDGLANTLALVDRSSEHPAAEWAHKISIGEFSDFYLPARHELRLCYLNVPELFSTSGWYWSSTQSSRITAWAQVFSDGGQGIIVKTDELQARAVRRLVIE